MASADYIHKLKDAVVMEGIKGLDAAVCPTCTQKQDEAILRRHCPARSTLYQPDVDRTHCLVQGCDVSYRRGCVQCKLAPQLWERKKEAMLLWKDVHKGQRGFILATGPSVALQDISWLRNELVVGINFAHKITKAQGWLPTYIATADANIMRRVRDEYEDLDSRIVCSDTVVIQTEYNRPNLVTKYGISILYREDEFSWDITDAARVVKAYSTVGHIALPWALWTGMNPIYLLGCDCTAGGHAYDDKGIVCPGAMTLWETGFFPAMAKARAEALKQGIQIYNATLGGRLESIPRVHFAQLKDSSARSRATVTARPRTDRRSISLSQPPTPAAQSSHPAPPAQAEERSYSVAPRGTIKRTGMGDADHYYDRYKGRRAFVLATGPSVAEQDISWLQDEVVIGVNFAHKVTLPQHWCPTFIACADHRLFPKVADEYEQLACDIVVSDTVRMYWPDYTAPNLATRRGVSLFPFRHTHGPDVFDWDCNEGVCVYHGSSTTGMLAIPWALWLGCNPIYLLGCDCTAKGHAYDDKGAVSPRAIKLWDQHFRPSMANIAKALAAEGRAIYNATKEGRLEELPRVDFDTLRPGS